jgi:aspartate aminotransferase
MDRMQKVVLYTANGVNSITQWGGVAALTGPQDCVAEFRQEYQARRDLFYEGIRDMPTFAGSPPRGAFYAFLRIADGWTAPDGRIGSWAMTEHLLQVKVGSSPGIIFGPSADNYLRFSTACDRDDLTGALEAMHALFGQVAVPV